MGKIVRLIFVGIVFVFGFLNVNGQKGNQIDAETGTLKKVKEIKELKKEAGKKSITDVKVRDEKGAIWMNGTSPLPLNPTLDPATDFEDPGKQAEGTSLLNNPSGLLITSMNGLPYSNINPPDPSIAVGPNHVIQMLNGTSGSLFMVTNKSGVVLIPATFMDQVTGIGGFADPIVLYDHLADRFIMMEMVNVSEAGSYGLSFAISKTGDPTGGWDIYFLSTGANLPDYPKLSMWPDAYYITTNEFTNASSYAGTFAYALERNAMLQGQPTTQSVRIRIGVQSKHSGACPVTLQGNPSGTNANGLIAWMQDDIWSTWDANDADSIGLIKFNVNWANPSLSFISNVASLATLPFKSNVCTATRGRCIPQTGTTIMLEALHQKIMNQPVYRAFSGFEGLVMTHTTDAGNEQAGVRWYELRKSDLTQTWEIGQQSTWAPDATHRFMPTISYNQRGDIALAYNVSDASGALPGLRFTGRRSCDPAGEMTVPETNIIAGSSYSGFSRFGDYNHMVADPLSGNFWVTGQYMPSFQWATRIAQFRIDSCVQVCDAPYNLYTKNLKPNTATIGWTQGAGINYYEVEYKNINDVNWIAAGYSLGDSLNLTNLTEAETYNWRIRSHCDFGNGLWVGGLFTTPLPVCTIPAGLVTTTISISTASLNWTKVPDAIDYILEYQQNGEASWTDLSVTANDSVYIISGITPSTNYTWRIKAVCTPTLQSDWAQQSFITPAEVCDSPEDLQTTFITSNSAKLSWLAVSNVQFYNLEYQQEGSLEWIQVPLGQGIGQYDLTALAPATTYKWRVRTVCTTVQSNWGNQTFTTAPELCQPPANLTALDITSGSAELNWDAVQGASDYRVEYQKAGVSSWTLLTTATTANSMYISGLTANSSYNWRVSATCPRNITGFSQASFVTTGSCATPSSPKTTNLSSGGATLSWTAVKSIIGYRVEYKLASADAWTILPNTTSVSMNLSGLLSETAYQWRVRTICAAGPSVPSVTQSFTTLGPPCPDPYEPNNTNKVLAAIPVNTDLFASVSSGTDQDWYSFYNTSAQPNIRISLSQLPANYSMTLYSPSGRALVKAAKTGLVDEFISYNTTIIGKYWLQVLPASSSEFNPSKCYRLRVDIQTGTNMPESGIINDGWLVTGNEKSVQKNIKLASVNLNEAFQVYPNPAKDRLFVKYNFKKTGKYIAIITDQTGQKIKEKALAGFEGETIEISNISEGIYILQLIKENKLIYIHKFFIKK